MTDIPRLIDQMQAAGVPADAILIAVRALAEQDERRKAEARGRKAKQRILQDNSHGTVVGQVGTVTPIAPLKDPVPLPEPLDPTPNPTPLQPPAPEAPQPAAKKAVRLSADWKPSADDIAFAKSQGWTDQEIWHEAERYRDYWVAKGGQIARKLDWPATWRNWIRDNGRKRHNPEKQQFGSNGARSGVDTLIAAGLRRVDSLRADGWPAPRGDEDDGLFAAKLG